MDAVKSRDQVLRKEYAKIPETVEEIAEDDAVANAFLKRVNDQLPAGLQLDRKDMKHRLFNLRKKGEDKGGLVRKQRSYNGRNNKPR